MHTHTAAICAQQRVQLYLMLRVLTFGRKRPSIVPPPPKPHAARPAKRPVALTGRGGSCTSRKVSGSQGVMRTRARASTQGSGMSGMSEVSGSQGGTGGKRKCGMLGIVVDDDADDTPAGETEKEHAARHRTFRATCIRCVFNANKSKLERHHGSYRHTDRRGNTLRTVWVAPRPWRMPGQFGVGCLFCNALRQRCEAELDAAQREGRTLPKQRRGLNYARTNGLTLRSALLRSWHHGD